MNIFVHMLPKFCLCLCEHIYVFVLNKNGSCLLFWNFLIFIFLLVNIELWGFFFVTNLSYLFFLSTDDW